MRPKLPENLRRKKTLEVWLLGQEVDEFRLMASKRGFRRKVAGSQPPVYRGDLSKLIHDVLKESAPNPTRWRALVARLQAAVDDTPNETRAGFVKIQMRVREVWLDRIRRLAADAGFVHGGRGNVSAFLRALLRLERDDDSRTDS